MPSYFLPEEMEGKVRDLLTAWSEVAFKESYVPPVYGISPNEMFTPAGSVLITPFRVLHTTPSLGYGLCTQTRKIKPEFAHKDKTEIVSLKQKGVPIDDEVVNVDLAFCGDTTIGVIRDPIVEKAKALILEVTFLDDSVSPEDAVHGGHIHIEHILKNLDFFFGKKMLFTHPSQRYAGVVSIRDRFLKRIPDLDDRGWQVVEIPSEWQR